MKRRMMTVLFIAIMVLTMNAAAASAATDLLRVSIPVSFVSDAGASGMITLSCSDRTEELRIDSGKTSSFELSYDKPGTYHYKIQRTAGTNKKIQYDPKVYNVIVGIYNGSNGLDCEVVLYEEGSKSKSSVAAFQDGQVAPPPNPPEDIEIDEVSTGDSNALITYFLTGLSALVILLLLLKIERGRRHE